jgi:hypothetical protein
MAILDYLPTFSVVEINRSTGLVAGHVLSQYQAGTLASVTEGTNDFIENGVIAGLSNDLTLEDYNATTHSQPFLIFTEELNTMFSGLKYFATPYDADDECYPRAIGLYVGDTFTTDNFSGDIAVDGFATVTAGIITLQNAAVASTLFVAEESTLPDGITAAKLTYVGVTA